MKDANIEFCKRLVEITTEQPAPDWRLKPVVKATKKLMATISLATMQLSEDHESKEGLARLSALADLTVDLVNRIYSKSAKEDQS